MSDKLHPYAELYTSPKGPGDARPTALQIVHDSGLVNKWAGKVALVTGATSGIGVETARALHATGADVFFTARDLQKAQSVISDILKSSEGHGKLEVIEMDMTSVDAVKKAAQDFLAKSSTLNVLVTNAGIMATPEGTTVDGVEQQFGVNHLAHFALTALLLPTLLRSSTPSFNSRVVTLSSNAHRYSTVHLEDVSLTNKYDPWMAYGQSKTASIWMANYIDRVYGPRGVHANSVNPGGIMTGLQAHVPAEMLEMWKSDPLMVGGMQSQQQGAATTLWAATANVWEGTGGKYLCDCGVGSQSPATAGITDPGYAAFAFDEEGEDKLWKLSLELAGVKIEG